MTNFIWGGSEQDDFLLELQDWNKPGQISAGAGRLIYFNMSAAECQKPEVTGFFKLKGKVEVLFMFD